MTNKGKMVEAVYAASLTKRATLVIFYLINRADEALSCFPSIRKIASECNMSYRTVQRAINDLEEAGFLIKENRFHTQGGQRSNNYILQIVTPDRELEFKNHGTNEGCNGKSVNESKNIVKKKVGGLEEEVIGSIDFQYYIKDQTQYRDSEQICSESTFDQKESIYTSYQRIDCHHIEVVNELYRNLMSKNVTRNTCLLSQIIGMIRGCLSGPPCQDVLP